MFEQVVRWAAIQLVHLLVADHLTRELCQVLVLSAASKLRAACTARKISQHVVACRLLQAILV